MSGIICAPLSGSKRHRHHGAEGSPASSHFLRGSSPHARHGRNSIESGPQMNHDGRCSLSTGLARGANSAPGVAYLVR